jgi:hypothetical protein
VPYPVAWFVLHFLEMCVVMCLGGIVLSALVFGAAALLGYPDLRQTAPVPDGAGRCADRGRLPARRRLP